MLALVISIVSCGCSDSRQDVTEEVTNPAATREPNRIAKQPVAAPPSDVEFRGPHDVIIAGQLTVDVMEIAAPPRANELGQRLKQAVSQNPDWWLDHVKKGKPGKPLPYDSRLGLSETEYNEFLVLSKKMTTQKKAEATILVMDKGDDVYVLDGGQDLADLTGIEVDLKHDLVRTPFGDLTERSKINASEDTALGAWDGVQWKLESPDPNGMTGTFATLAVGKLRVSGRGVYYYDVKKISRDQKTRISHILNFDAPTD